MNARLKYGSLLTLLIICGLMLAARIAYLYLADAYRFPINTVKIAANYHHVSRKQLEGVLANYLNASFFSIPTSKLRRDLLALDWSEQVEIERVWPDTLKIKLVEKTPVAIWNDSLMAANGDLFNVGQVQEENSLPQLRGPTYLRKDILQIYQKLSKLLATYGLQVAALEMRDNQAWELFLTNGIQLRLGKQDIEKRLLRFCRAYPAVFADKPEQLTSVDLRYARGMAVQWKQQTRK